MSAHIDDTGQPCPRHAGVPTARILELAAIGSRIGAFHHDAASKLQSLMMALAEIHELTECGTPELRVAAETAQVALRELHQLFAANRAFAKPPERSRLALRDLMRVACDRSGVRLGLRLPTYEVEVAVPAMTHALALLADLVAGPVHLGRMIAVTAIAGDRDVTLALAGPAEALASPPPSASESVAIAAFLIERDGGELKCHATENQIAVRLATAR